MLQISHKITGGSFMLMCYSTKFIIPAYRLTQVIFSSNVFKQKSTIRSSDQFE